VGEPDRRADDVFEIRPYDTRKKRALSWIWNLFRVFALQDTNARADLPSPGVRIVERGTGRVVLDDWGCARATPEEFAESLRTTTAAEFAARWGITDES
jgi:hypothetical protein